jgi:hypothetical protein
VPAGQELRVPVAGTAGVPADAGAAAFNVTLTGPRASGWLRVHPSGGAQPETSNLNFRSGQTIPNSVLTGLGDGGEVCLSGSADTHVVVDLMGWFG